MPTISRSAKLYQERRQPQFDQTLRGPGPQVYLPDNPVHTIKLEPPLPYPNARLNNPDSACGISDTRTQVWPYGDNYAPET